MRRQMMSIFKDLHAILFVVGMAGTVRWTEVGHKTSSKKQLLSISQAILMPIPTSVECSAKRKTAPVYMVFKVSVTMKKMCGVHSNGATRSLPRYVALGEDYGQYSIANKML